jgi:hypothetical protein
MKKFVLVLCAACGGDDSDTMSDAAPEVPPPANTGFVQIASFSQMPFGGPPENQGLATATFEVITGVPVCAETEVGPCIVQDCFGKTQPVTRVNAGTITVTGAALPIMLAPDADTIYSRVAATQLLFSGDETLTVTGSGGDVPAFAVSLTAPTQPTITSPGPPPGPARPVIDRAQPFHATWTNSKTTGKVYFYFEGPTYARVAMSCGFDSSALSGEIPANALASLPAGPGTLTMSSGTVAHDDVGEWRAEVQTYFNALWPDGRYATMEIEIK